MDVNEQADHAASVETTDRGLFDFKKEDDPQKPQEEVIASEFNQKLHVSKTGECVKEEAPREDEKKHESLLEKLHQSDSSSSSSSDEGDDEEKKKREKEKKEKKGLNEKLKKKLGGHKDEEDTNVPIENCEEKQKFQVQEVVHSEPSHPVPADDQEKKGFLDKIKDKLPGQQKKEDRHEAAEAAPVATPEPCAEGEKKGFLNKIKEKIPGFHSKNAEEKRELAEEKKEDH